MIYDLPCESDEQNFNLFNDKIILQIFIYIQHLWCKCDGKDKINFISNYDNIIIQIIFICIYMIFIYIKGSYGW